MGDGYVTGDGVPARALDPELSASRCAQDGSVNLMRNHVVAVEMSQRRFGEAETGALGKAADNTYQ